MHLLYEHFHERIDSRQIYEKAKGKPRGTNFDINCTKKREKDLHERNDMFTQKLISGFSGN